MKNRRRRRLPPSSSASPGVSVSTAKVTGYAPPFPLIKLLMPVQYLAMNSSSGGGTPGVVSVVGATGRQGSAVVRHLLQDGWQVRALTRNPSSKASVALGRMGADVHRVDTEDVASLAPVFRGSYGVFNVQNPMTSSAEAEVRQGRNVAAAAADAAVKHVVYGAAGVGDYKTGVGSWDSKLVVAERFRELGLPLTVLRPMTPDISGGHPLDCCHVDFDGSDVDRVCEADGDNQGAVRVVHDGVLPQNEGCVASSGMVRAAERARSPTFGRPRHGQRWFLRGFTNISSLFSFLAFLPARFSRIVLPVFLAAPLLGDFPDTGITPFHACVYPIPYLLLFFMPVRKNPATPRLKRPQSTDPSLTN